MRYQKLSTIKRALNAPMYEGLTSNQLTVYKTGFKYGYKVARTEYDEKVKDLKRIIKKLRSNTSGVSINATRKKRIPSTQEVNNIIDSVCNMYALTKEGIIAKSRLSIICQARSLILNILFDNFDLSLSHIGRMFNMDHSSVLHHVRLKLYNKRYWTPDSPTWNDYQEIQKLIN